MRSNLKKVGYGQKYLTVYPTCVRFSVHAVKALGVDFSKGPCYIRFKFAHDNILIEKADKESEDSFRLLPVQGSGQMQQRKGTKLILKHLGIDPNEKIKPFRLMHVSGGPEDKCVVFKVYK